MHKPPTYIILIILLTILSGSSLYGQELLKPSRIQARGVRKNLQELVEEMTAAEHLCPFIEFDPLEYEVPDPEIDYEWEMDMHEIL